MRVFSHLHNTFPHTVIFARAFNKKEAYFIDKPLNWLLTSTNNIGVDGVIISTSSSDNSIISNSTKILRKKGRIVLVGTSGLDLKRSDFYEKEISFQVSCSYGPGR